MKSKAKQIKKGTKVEAEHTKGRLFKDKVKAKTPKSLAKKIAKDHVKEIPDYYDRLAVMEKKAKKKKK